MTDVYCVRSSSAEEQGKGLLYVGLEYQRTWMSVNFLDKMCGTAMSRCKCCGSTPFHCPISDSNPSLRGPTINLHAAAKPLMKPLYGRQALALVRHNRDLRLTSMTAKIYGSYLSYLHPPIQPTPRVDLLSRCEYVSASTKSTILGDLSLRAQAEYDTLAEATLLNDIVGMFEAPGSLEWPYSKMFEIISCLALHESSAVAIAEGNILNSLEKLLRSRPTQLLHQRIFSALESLVSHEYTAMAVVRMPPFDLLGTRWGSRVKPPLRRPAVHLWLLCSEISPVIDGALWLLSRVAHLKFPPVTTGVSVEARLLAHIADMLEAPNTSEGHYPVIFQILSHLALHESTAVAILEADTLNTLEKLKSSPTDLTRHIFSILENLASHESTVMAVVSCSPLTCLGLTGGTSPFTYTFPQKFTNSFSKNPGTLSANLLEIWSENLVTAELLHSPHKASAEATWSSLVVSVCHSDMPQVADRALWVLSRVPQIQFPPVTAGVSVEAKLLDRLLDMLQDSSTTEWRYSRIFQIISTLALHEPTAVTVVEANVLNSVDKLLRAKPTDLRRRIFSMLERLASYELQGPSSACSPSTCLKLSGNGAEGMVATKALDNVLSGLHSYSHPMRLATCRLLRPLVEHESTVQAVVAIVARKDIVALFEYGSHLFLFDPAYLVRKCAVETVQVLDTTLERIDGNFHILGNGESTSES
ncbi:hypothetical protein C8J57DRAFT_1250480 [Mycena rebaudengoi]|nr:hypothetical protein C8J57DRAFT_1250480 [Mycena rebaudengoi]